MKTDNKPFIPMGYPLWLVRLDENWYVIFSEIGKMKVSKEIAEKMKLQPGVVKDAPELAGFNETYVLP